MLAGGRQHVFVPVQDAAALTDEARDIEILELDELLTELGEMDDRAARIVELEDRIAVIDFELETVGPRPTSGRTVVLWSDRVELLDELVRARAGVEGSGDVVVAVKRTNGREP